MWLGVLDHLGDSPLDTTPATLIVSQRLYQRLLEALTSTTGSVFTGYALECTGKGLELSQALHDQFQPNDVVTLPLASPPATSWPNDPSTPFSPSLAESVNWLKPTTTRTNPTPKPPNI